MNEVEINNKIDSSGGYISKIYNRRHFEFSLHILSNSFSDVLPVFTDCIFKSIYPEDIIRNKLENEKKSFIINSSKVTEKARDKFKEILYGNDHLYGKKTELDDFDNLNSNNLSNIHSNICNFQYCSKNLISNLSILISGDYPKNITQMLEFNLPDVFENNSFEQFKCINKTRSSYHYISKKCTSNCI